MSESNTLKQIYNKTLLRAIKAETLLDSPDTSRKQIERYIPEFLKVMQQLNDLLQEIKEFSHDEVCNGFKVN